MNNEKIVTPEPTPELRMISSCAWMVGEVTQSHLVMQRELKIVPPSMVVKAIPFKQKKKILFLWVVLD